VESKWRQNVVAFGLDSNLVRLCSPLLGNTFWKLTDWAAFPGYHAAFFNQPSDPNNYNMAALIPDLNSTGRFPYGWAVEPD